MYDEEIEKTVLYFLIFQKEELSLKETDFFMIRNKQIYNAIEELKGKKEEVNILSIKEQIKGKDVDILKYLGNIAESYYQTSIEYAYKKLKKLSKKDNC